MFFVMKIRSTPFMFQKSLILITNEENHTMYLLKILTD